MLLASYFWDVETRSSSFSLSFVPHPRLERLQRIVTKVQMESGVCEEQLNQLDSQMQTVSRAYRPQAETDPGPRQVTILGEQRDSVLSLPLSLFIQDY